MKKFLSILLAILMVATALPVFAISDGAIVITNTSPAIAAIVGRTVDLTAYSVVFDGDTSATSSIVWKNSDDVITEFTPDAKGVTLLTAESGSKSKTIYVVAKNSGDSEYVLYENDFTGYSSVDELTAEGYAFLNDSSCYSVSSSGLVVGSLSVEIARVVLPEWLGDFGDYSITSELQMLESMNDGRWASIVYRSGDASASYLPYMHMCVRQNTTYTNGIELAERTTGNLWNVGLKASGSVASLASGVHTFNVKAFGTNVNYSIDGSSVVNQDYAALGTMGTYTKGLIGLNVNYARVAFKNIKVALTVDNSAYVEGPIVIENNSPAIPATAGSVVDLSKYSVVFDGDTDATSGLTWKNEAGSVITEFIPAAKGVTKLTAESESKSKTIYVVAKNPGDTEYVLYENDYTKYSSLDELKNEGYVFLDPDANYSVSSTGLNVGSKSDDYTRVILPEWLGDFANYSITSNLQMIQSLNTGRWASIVYRIENSNGGYYPYIHMCVRDDTTATNGIELAERTANDAWNVVATAAGTVSSLTSGVHKFNVQALDSTVKYSINDAAVIYQNYKALGTMGAHTKGMVGFTTNYSVVAFKDVKITLMTEEISLPDELKPANDLTLVNPISNVQSVGAGELDSVIASMNTPENAYFKVSEMSNIASDVQKILDAGIHPTFEVDSVTESDAVIAVLNANEYLYPNFVSSNAATILNLRNKLYTSGSGLIVDLNDPDISSKDADAIRRAVRSAPATFCVVKSENATIASVSELQELALAVWVVVEAEPGTDAYKIEALKAVSSGANGIISKSASELENVINDFLSANAMTRTPLIIGHRGAPNLAPENSVSGCVAAADNGADVVEIDVYLTSDGQSVVVHNTTINYLTNYTGSKTVDQMTLSEIKQYYLYNGTTLTSEKVPTLEEVLVALKDKDCRVFVEFKTSNTDNVITAMQTIQNLGMVDRVDVISFNTSYIAQTYQTINGMSTGYLYYPYLNSGNMSAAEYALNTYYGTAQAYQSTLNPNNQCMDIYFSQVATDRGMTVWPWTYNSSSNNSAFFTGAAGITTDDPQWAKSMAKFISANASATLTVGGSVAPQAYVTTYGGSETLISTSSLGVKIISGSDKIKYENGALVGLSDGFATVMYEYATTTTDGSTYVLYTQPVTVVVGNPAASVVETTDSVSPDGEYIRLIEGMSVNDFLANAKDSSITVYVNGEIVTGDTKIGNGATVTDDAGHVFMLYVFGDVNSDMRSSSADYLLLKRHFLGFAEFNDIEYKAACISGNDEIHAIDYVLLKRYFIGTYNFK